MQLSFNRFHLQYSIKMLAIAIAQTKVEITVVYEKVVICGSANKFCGLFNFLTRLIISYRPSRVSLCIIL